MRDPTPAELQDLIGFDDVARLLGVQTATARRYTYGYRPGFPEPALKPLRTLFHRRDVEKHYGFTPDQATESQRHGELIGYADIAQMLGLSKKTIHVHAHITTTFPTPAVLARQPLFRRHDIANFAATLDTPRSRRTGRPSNRTVARRSQADNHPTATTIADRIHLALAEKRPDLALEHFKRLNDELLRAHGKVRVTLVTAEPPPTGSRRWDAALAALVAHRLGEEQLAIPPWANDASRFLRSSWALNPGVGASDIDRDQVPAEFLARSVLVDLAMFDSAPEISL